MLLLPPHLARGYSTIVPKRLAASHILACLRGKNGRSARTECRPTCCAVEFVDSIRSRKCWRTQEIPHMMTILCNLNSHGDGYSVDRSSIALRLGNLRTQPFAAGSTRRQDCNTRLPRIPAFFQGIHEQRDGQSERRPDLRHIQQSCCKVREDRPLKCLRQRSSGSLPPR